MLTISRIRIVSALVLSLFIHAGMMTLNSGWLQPEGRSAIVPRRVTMTLTARKPKPVSSPVPVIEEKTPPVIEQKTVHKIEKIVVREIPRPVAAPPEPKLVVARETIIEKSTPETVEAPVAQQQEIVVTDSVAERVFEGKAEEKPTLLPVFKARPLYKKNPRPEYPSVARRRRYQGTTLLEVLVDSQGRVGELRVSQSCGHDILDRAALTAVQGWLFEPGKRGDDTVVMWVRVPVRFQLR